MLVNLEKVAQGYLVMIEKIVGIKRSYLFQDFSIILHQCQVTNMM